MESNNSQILIDKDGYGVATISLNNPPLNLITLEMSQRLIEAMQSLENDSTVRVIIIQGCGEKAFCAGADISEFKLVRDSVVEKKLKKENEAMDSIAFCKKPVIAAVENIALGGGCEISLACDMRVMSESAKIGLPEINLGVFPGSGGIFRLPKLVGVSKAIELMSTGEFITADEAMKIGLINKIASNGKAYKQAYEMAVTIAKNSAIAVQFIKQGVRESISLDHREMMRLNLELSDQIFKTEDCNEGIEAFFNKRKPVFNK